MTIFPNDQQMSKVRVLRVDHQIRESLEVFEGHPEISSARDGSIENMLLDDTIGLTSSGL